MGVGGLYSYKGDLFHLFDPRHMTSDIPSSSDEPTITLRIAPSLAEVSAKAWDSVANPGWDMGPKGQIEPFPPVTTAEERDALPSFNPFVTHAFLNALEESGCATRETGWAPRHVLLETDNKLLGAVPAYLKNHSQGEYVFDQGWADAFYRAGGEYYPKLQVAVPFTPVPGPRFLLARDIDPDTGRAALASGLVEICKRTGASSVHATFLPEAEWTALGELGYLQRTDQQFHWWNRDYKDFDSFLADLSSRHRKTIRKERREALDTDITIEWVTGKDLTEAHWDAFFAFYMDTGSRKWGSPYLNRKFFSMLGERLAERVLLILAKRDGRYIAGALNLIGSDTLFGRNWGCLEYHPCLHFEVCYYQAIDYAIAHGLSRVEAGAQGEHKLARGYVPTLTYSAHWIAHPGLRDAVADYLEHERAAVTEESRLLGEHAPFRKGS